MTDSMPSLSPAACTSAKKAAKSASIGRFCFSLYAVGFLYDKVVFSLCLITSFQGTFPLVAHLEEASMLVFSVTVTVTAALMAKSTAPTWLHVSPNPAMHMQPR